MTESKQGMWDEINKLRSSSPIVSAVFELHSEGMIEDKEGALMRIVLMQQGQIESLEKTQATLLQDRYRRRELHA